MRSSMLQWSAAACAALALTACEDNRNRAMQEPGPNNATPQGQAKNPQNQNQGQRPAGGVEAVNDAPSRFYGKKLSLVGDVDEVYNDRAFELDGADWAFNDNITVLTKNPVSVEGAPLRSSDDIVVSGTVRPFAVADIEKEIGWDIPADLENKLNKRPVLVADTIHKMTGCGTWSASPMRSALRRPKVTLSTNDPSFALRSGWSGHGERTSTVAPPRVHGRPQSSDGRTSRPPRSRTAEATAAISPLGSP